MRVRGLSQEGLKIIACVTMVVDHIGAVLLPWGWLRMVGRIAFPIYCYLVGEGMKHTKAPGRYLLRLGIGAVISEVPFDLLFYGGPVWDRCSVMVTLLLGASVLWSVREGKPLWGQLAAIVVGVFLAEVLGADYGGLGVLTILALYFPMAWPGRLGVLALLFWSMGGAELAVLGLQIPVQLFGLLALVPIGAYSGRKGYHSRGIQWAFYLVYPVHLFVLWLICNK